jgi:hypothetical protein
VQLTEPLAPALAPRPQRGPEIAQALETEQIRRNRDHHVIGGDQGRPVDRTQAGPDVNEHDVGAVPLGDGLT